MLKKTISILSAVAAIVMLLITANALKDLQGQQSSESGLQNSQETVIQQDIDVQKKIGPVVHRKC